MIALFLLACAASESRTPSPAEVATAAPAEVAPAAPASTPAAVPPGPRLAVAGGLWCAATQSGELRCGSASGDAPDAKDAWAKQALSAVQTAALSQVHALRMGRSRLVALQADGHISVLPLREEAALPVTQGPFQALSRGAAAQTLCALDAQGGATCWSDEWQAAAAPSGPFVALADDLDGDVCGLLATGRLICWSTSTGELQRLVTNPDGPFRALARNVNGVCLAPENAAPTCTPGLPAAPDGALVTLALNPGDATSPPQQESACGITADGALRCWGNAGDPPAGRFVDVASEDAYTCGLREDDQVLCWKHVKDYETGPGDGG